MPSCAFQDCTSTWVLFAKYFKHILLPHPQSVAKTGSTLPAFERECQLRSSAFPNQTDNLSLRCFSRKSKNYSFSRLVPSLLHHGGRWSRVCLQIPEPNCNLEWFQHCTSTWVLFAEYSKHSMLPHPQSVAKTGSTLPAFQRECQLRSSAFPNQTDNLSLRCFSRKSKNYSFSRLVPSLLHGGRWSLVCPEIGRGHPGRTWCWSQLFNVSDARIIWITSRCQYLFFFHVMPNPASQASSSKNAQEQ